MAPPFPKPSPEAGRSVTWMAPVALLTVGALTWLGLDCLSTMPPEGKASRSPALATVGGDAAREQDGRDGKLKSRTILTPQERKMQEWKRRVLTALQERTNSYQEDLRDAWKRHPRQVTFDDQLDVHLTPLPVNLDAELKAIDAEIQAMDPDQFRATTRAMEDDPTLGTVERFNRLSFMVKTWMGGPQSEGSAGLQAQLEMLAEFLPQTLPHGGDSMLMYYVLEKGMKQDPPMMTDFMIQHWGLWDGVTGDRTGNVWKSSLLEYDLDPERRRLVKALPGVQ